MLMDLQISKSKDIISKLEDELSSAKHLIATLEQKCAEKNVRITYLESKVQNMEKSKQDEKNKNNSNTLSVRRLTSRLIQIMKF